MPTFQMPVPELLRTIERLSGVPGGTYATPETTDEML